MATNTPHTHTPDIYMKTFNARKKNTVENIDEESVDLK